MTYLLKNNELYHYGVKGQKWGVRRYQNPDGSPISRKELRADNEQAYTNGAAATIAGKAYDHSAISYEKARSRYEKALAKDPEGIYKRTQRLKMTAES